MAEADRRQSRLTDDDDNKDIGRPVEREQGADEEGKGQTTTTSRLREDKGQTTTTIKQSEL